MERLELISPPDNIDKYTPNCFVRRKKRFSLKMGRHEWGKVFACCDFSIKWVIPWWKLKKMIGCNTQPFCRLPSLSKLTFYYPCRVKRQYGTAQTIPTGDLRRPYEFPVSQEVERFDGYWCARPLWKVITQKASSSLSNDVKRWLNGRSQKDRTKIEKTNVKTRLGDKKIPAKERLGGRVEFKTPVIPKKKSANKDKGKRKFDSTEKKVWVEKKHGVLAVGETIHTKIECRASYGCLLAKVMDEKEASDKNWKRMKKEKKD